MKQDTPGQSIRLFAFMRSTNMPVPGDAANITSKIKLDEGAEANTATANPTEAASGGGYYFLPVTQAETNAATIQALPVSSTAGVQVISMPGVIYTDDAVASEGSSQGIFRTKMLAETQKAGDDVYMTIRNADTGQVWNGSAMVNYVEGNRSGYAQNLADNGGGRYSAPVPSGLSHNNYIFKSWKRVVPGVTSASDTALDKDAWFWDGTNINKNIFRTKMLAETQKAGDDVYMTIRNADTGLIWNGSTLVSYVEGNRSAYALTLADNGGGRYSAAVPTSLPAPGNYIMEAWKRVVPGATSAADTAIDKDAWFWDGVNLNQGIPAAAGGGSSGATATLANQITLLNNLAGVQADTTTILGRIGAFAGTGLNTVLGFLRAMFNKAAGLTPSGLVSGATGDNTTDSLEALRDALPSGGASQASVDAIRAEQDVDEAAVLAAVGLRASQASVNAVRAEQDADEAAIIAAIGVGGGSGSSAGSGADLVTIVLKKPDNITPVPDADVWITSTSNPTASVVAGTKQTDSNGRVSFLLDNGSSYFLWAQKDGSMEINGQLFIAVKDV